MRYNSREELERIGRAGSYYERSEHGIKARILSTFWLHLDPADKGFVPHQTTGGEGFWESWLTLWVSQNVEPGSNCIDIGANVGYYTLFLLDHGCSVRAVEPQPYLADLIELSVKENMFTLETGTVDRNVVDGKSGTATLNIPHEGGMNASIMRDFPDMVSVSHEVDAYTLDDYCEGKDYFDFVKIDAEGVEHNLFRGARRFIKNNPNCVYMVEWFGYEVESTKELYELFDVSFVRFDGSETPLPTPADMRSVLGNDWITLILRKKK